MPSDTQFKTTDSSLASFLITSGHKLISIDYSQPRYELYFEESPDIPTLKDLQNKFLLGTALTNPSVFDKVNKKLLRIIRSQIQWEDD